MRKIIQILACCMAMPAFAMESADILVKVEGIKSDKGQLIVSVYKDSESWLKNKLALQTQSLSVNGKEVSTHFKLPPGTYAIHVYQDENANGKLDMRWLPPGPAEPWVVSNNAQGTMGPPSYKDAKIEVQGDLALTMQLQ